MIEPARFIREVFGARKMNMTYDILQFLNSFVSEAITTVLAEAKATLGLGIEEAVIENIGLPPEVEKLVDEQSGLGLASQDMSAYMQYQTVRAMRDASKQKGGLAGLGAGIAFGNHIAGTISSETPSGEDSIAKLWEYKKLLDEGVLSQDEFDALKKKALKI